MVEAVIPILVLNFRTSTQAIQAFLPSFRLLIKLSLSTIKVNLVGQSVKFVERVVIQLLIVTIEWILFIKEGMHLLSLLPWWPKLLRFKLPTLGLQTRVVLIM